MYSLGVVTLFLVSATIIFKAPSTAAQLLFPVNNQVTFGPDGLQSESSLRGTEREGAGALWIENRVPRIAIIGAGAAGELHLASAVYGPANSCDVEQDHLLLTFCITLPGWRNMGWKVM